MKACSVDIEDRSSGLTDVLRGGGPQIGGCNCFTGEYDRGSGLYGMNSSDQADWDSFWRDTLGTAPPGPLPKGAKAVMIAEHHDDDPLEFFPDSVVLDDRDIRIEWRRIHLDPESGNNGRSRYAVLLIPDYPDRQSYRDVFMADERQKARRFADELKIITEGTTAPVTLMPVAKLRKKTEFLKF